MPSSPKGPCRTGKATSQPSSPPAGAQLDLARRRRASGRRARSAPRPPRGPPSRRPAATEAPGLQRDLVLGGAPAADHRDLHRRLRPGRRSWSSVGGSTSSGSTNSPTTIVTVSPARSRVPGAGAWSSTRPSSDCSSVSCSIDVDAEARGSQQVVARRPPTGPRRSGTITEPAPVETMIVTRSPRSSSEPGARVLADHRALGLVGVARVDVDDEAEPLELGLGRPPAESPSTSGSVTRFGALGDDRVDRRLAVDLLAAGAARSRSPGPRRRRARTLLASSRPAGRASSSRSRASASGRPRDRRHPDRAEPEADGERHRRALLGLGAAPAGPARSPCLAVVAGLDPSVVDLEARAARAAPAPRRRGSLDHRRDRPPARAGSAPRRATAAAASSDRREDRARRRVIQPRSRPPRAAPAAARRRRAAGERTGADRRVGGGVAERGAGGIGLGGVERAR